MENKRFFVKDLELFKNNTYDLVKDDYNYIVNVMRQKVGDKIVISNNTGYDFLCQIKNIQKNSLTIMVEDETFNTSEPKVNLTVCQALVKGDKFELILQKISELGATKLIPFTSQFTMVKNGENKEDRLIKIALNATRQCGRAKMLDINPIISIKKLAEELKSYDLVLLAYEKGGVSLKEATKNKKDLKNVAIIVGSEGGFSESEVEFLESNVKNLKTISLGERILRAETASIVLTGLVMYELGELE
ncbi:MAG: 16S rRNA (uracil(1498)-N(3))-methyltransferase [Spirochaetales bacterium]